MQCTVGLYQPQQLVLEGLAGGFAEMHLDDVGGLPNAAGQGVVMMDVYGLLPSALHKRLFYASIIRHLMQSAPTITRNKNGCLNPLSPSGDNV